MTGLAAALYAPAKYGLVSEAVPAHLLVKANAFFAQAERDVVAERKTAITEIQALMTTYGLSVDDLQDEGDGLLQHLV